MSVREEVLQAHRNLLDRSDLLSYFHERGIPREVVKQAYVGYEAGAFVYPCIAPNDGLLAIHSKSKNRDDKNKRRQWWGGYAEGLPHKGSGKNPDAPAKVIPFGLETLKNIEPDSPVILCCGEEDALSLRQVGYTALSQPGAGLLEPVYARELSDLAVVIFYDAGEEKEASKDALKVEQAGAKSVCVVQWPPEAPHGADVNGRLVEDAEGFREWAYKMIVNARPLLSIENEVGTSHAVDSNQARYGRPDLYERSTEEQNNTGLWKEPVTLPDGLPPVMDFDLEMLPSALRGWIADVAERMQIPPDFCAAGAVVVAGSLIGRKFGISPKRHDDWTVVPNLWGAAVGRPAMLKSPALAEIMKPLDRLVAEAREEYEQEYAAYEREASMHKAEAKARDKDLEAAAREAVKSGNRDKLEEAADKQREAGEPAEPEPRRYKTEDPTVEKLCDLLISNPQGILVHRDELSGWLRSLDKQGRESDRSLYLEAWNGTGSYEVDRIGRGSLYVPALCVSILGGIQPGPLSSYVWEATRGAEGNDGLLQRFQLLVWPDSPKVWRNVDRYPDSAEKNRAFDMIGKLDALTAEEFGAVSEDAAIPTVRFTQDAQREFDAFREELERKLRSGELSGALEAHLAKYRSLFPALALLFAAVDRVDGHDAGVKRGTVSQECALRAWAWCEYLESHAHRLYSSAEDPAMEGARALLEKIKAGEVKDGVTTREVHRRHWTRLATPERLGTAAGILEDYGWLHIETLKTGGRDTTRIRLHPTLRTTG